MKRNWSAVPPMPAPPELMAHEPEETDSLPAGVGPPISWQTNPLGQLGSAGGAAGVTGAKAYSLPLPEPKYTMPLEIEGGEYVTAPVE